MIKGLPGEPIISRASASEAEERLNKPCSKAFESVYVSIYGKIEQLNVKCWRIKIESLKDIADLYEEVGALIFEEKHNALNEPLSIVIYDYYVE